ncbi:MAG: hypothetical protein DRJ42_27920 [Deltaproteobacteria bacterium]|nr:MAG: hypothetical protein DRJ42_27920 [Deltaproteobacteria bacterium]
MDLTRAAHYYERGCEAGSAHGCGSLGVLRFYGHGVPADSAGGLDALTRGCDGRYGQACANLGVIYALGRSVEVDTVRGAELFERGCALGSALGCSSRCDLCAVHALPRCGACGDLSGAGREIEGQ